MFKQCLIIALCLALGFALGWQKNWLSGEEDAPDSAGERKPLYWVAPMDRNYRRDGPGLSPMGMALIPVYEEQAAADSTVRITPTVEHNLGLKTAPVRTEKLSQPIHTIGTVQYDESQITHLHSRVDGWIETLNVAAKGDRVRRGQVLFELYSPVLVNAQNDFLLTLRSGNRNLMPSVRSRLLALGLTLSHVAELERRGQVEQTVRFVADRDGVVLNLNVRQGMFITPSTEVLAIGTLDSVWVLGEVFERQAYRVRVGQPVELSLPAAPGRQWTGEVSHLYPELEGRTRTLTVRARVPNTDHFLKPNMLMRLEVQTEEAEPTLSIPRSALIRGSRQARVVVALDAGRFQSVLVEPGLEGISAQDGTPRVQILSGLKTDDRVVISAQFLIDSESDIEAELARMESTAETAAVTPAGNFIDATGTVVAIKPDAHVLTLTHAPIPALGWPAMTMDFDVDPALDLSGLQSGQEIEFRIEHLGQWDYPIRWIGVTRPADHSTMDHSTMDHSSMDHSTMDHSSMDHSTMDHRDHGQSEPDPATMRGVSKP
jgi:Cu(I)/Ag(I) efflux system membrane fusion protein